MKKVAILSFGILCALDVQAASRRLSTDCTVPSSYTPSESAPVDLDWCTIGEGDEIGQLLIDIANRWPGSLYVRAPSRSLTVQTDTTNWASAASSPVKTFVFLEDQDPANKLTIAHRQAPTNKYVLWSFKNFRTVKIGGPKLSITFKGTHPGLGNGNPETNTGLLDFRSDDGGTPELLDVRANVSHAEDYGFYVGGSVYGTTVGGTTDRIKQLNLSGKFWNAPVYVHGNVQKLWYDPEGMVVSDPYNRTMGWDGTVSGTSNGRSFGCYDQARRQHRTAGGSFYYVDKATGGLTIEYGTLNFVLRMVGAVGNSQTDPFVVKIKDWGASGPQSLTGYPSGVAVKQSVEGMFFKGDPHPEMGHTSPFRFIRFEMLPPDYGNGAYPWEVGRCAAGNATNNNFHSGYSNWMRLEANRGGQAFRSVNALWDVEYAGDFTSKVIQRGPLLLTAMEPEDSPGPTDPDRSYGHTIRTGAGTTISDTLNMMDNNVVTGQGTWTNVTAVGTQTSSGARLYPKANAVKATNVKGMVDLGPNATGTTISNVDFTAGPARTIVRVNAGSDVAISAICAPSGSQIVGTGLATYEGQPISLPYTLSATNNCRATGESVPKPPELVEVR